MNYKKKSLWFYNIIPIVFAFGLLGCDKIVFTKDLEPVKSVAQAKPGIFIPPYVNCKEPLDGNPGTSNNGQVCTPVYIAGSTELGRYYPDYADCKVVRTNRPYYPQPPHQLPDPNDPRMQDPQYVNELEWVREQALSSACTCCHDSRVSPLGTARWQVDHPGNWIDTASNRAISMFAGYGDSHPLGAYENTALNNGFNRIVTGMPSTDTNRMRAFMDRILADRGVSIENAKKEPPFGSPTMIELMYPTQELEACLPGQGVMTNGKVLWTGGEARYVFIMSENSKNPVVPPNLFLPEGTIWRLDVPADKVPLKSGIAYGKTPKDTSQSFPVDTRAAALSLGTNYHLIALKDVGIVATNCLFTYGNVTEGQEAPTDQFGGFCTDDKTCQGDVNFCFLPPAKSQGYCSATGCLTNPEICPENWTCLDLSIFSPILPSVCKQP